MTALFTLMLLLAPPVAGGLDQIRTEANAEHRARLAIEFGAATERNAESAYSKGDLAAVEAALKTMQLAIELARDSFLQTGKTPQRHAGLYKSAELKTQEMLVRLEDLERRMDADERHLVEGPKAKVQEIHDVWFEGIMSKKR